MISLDNIAVRYGPDIVALESVSLTFAANEVTVLLGPSGAGKSTLLRSLNLLTRPSAGTIEVDGIGVLNDRAAVREHRCRTAMIFQQHQLISRLTALQNVMVGRIGKYASWRTLLPMPAADRRFGLECLDRVGLLPRALERAGNLSGGQQQRVGIARALAQEPRLILADEPVASLDPATSERVLRHLHDISKQDRIPAIVSLHQVDLAKTFADRIIGLSDGRIVFDGKPGALGEEALRGIYGDTGNSKKEDAPEAARSDESRNRLNEEMEALG